MSLDIILQEGDTLIWFIYFAYSNTKWICFILLVASIRIKKARICLIIYLIKIGIGIINNVFLDEFIINLNNMIYIIFDWIQRFFEKQKCYFIFYDIFPSLKWKNKTRIIKYYWIVVQFVFEIKHLFVNIL